MNAIATVIAYVLTVANGSQMTFFDRESAIEMADHYRAKGREFTLTGADGEILDTLARERLVWQHIAGDTYRATRKDGTVFEIAGWGGTYASHHRAGGDRNRIAFGPLADVKAAAQTHSNGLHNSTIFDPWASYPTV